MIWGRADNRLVHNNKAVQLLKGDKEKDCLMISQMRGITPKEPKIPADAQNQFYGYSDKTEQTADLTDKGFNFKLIERYLQNRFKKASVYYFIHSYGCQANVADGERIQGVLQAAGCLKTEDKALADIVVLNACAVRENAQNRVIGNLGEVVAQKRRSKNKIIILCGCMFQQRELSNRIANTFSEADLIFGAKSINEFPNLLLGLLKCGGQIVKTDGESEIVDERLPTLRGDRVNALVPISYGCDNYCSYCIVPYVKGTERSRTPKNVTEEVKRLVFEGYKQITLLGQNVNSYGKKEGYRTDFPALLYKLNEIDGDFRIRFFTSHPKDATAELIDAMSELPKVCKHLHLPFQSGSDRILAKMNRRYSADDYLKIIDYAKKKIDGITFTSDVIVGFPGEEESDFALTLKLVEEVRFLSLFTFIYSKRPYTEAAEMEDKTPAEEKSKRLIRLIELQNQISERIHKSYLGQTERILIEGKSRADKSYLTGRTDTHLVVDIKDDGRVKKGDFVRVKINEAFRLALRGEVII